MQDKQEEQTTAVATTSPQASLARFNWTGLNPSQMKGVAQAMAMSGMFPDIQRDSAKAFVKIMAGQEMGIPPFQAMSDISIIQGKAAAGGNIYAAKVKATPGTTTGLRTGQPRDAPSSFSRSSMASARASALASSTRTTPAPLACSARVTGKPTPGTCSSTEP